MKKIVIQVHMQCDRFRSKALKIAVAFEGVISVSLEGENRDLVVVIGDYRIDPVYLTNKLRKKFSKATLLSMEYVNGDASSNNEEEEGEGECESEEQNTNSMENLSCCHFCAHNYPPCCPYPSNYVVYADDPYPPNSCSFM